MLIEVKRKWDYGDTVIGEMYIDKTFYCYTCEDKDNGWTKDTSVGDILKTKVIKHNCIPTGDYRVILSMSVKLKRYLPLILDVPAYKGIRIHKGVSKDWSSGCILVSKKRNEDNERKLDFGVTQSTEKELVKILDKANKKEPLYITITREF